MNDTKFFPTKKALITVIAASVVVIIALGIRQTFGMFYFDFATDLDITITQFGFTMGLQLYCGVFSVLCLELLRTSTVAILQFLLGLFFIY